MDGLDRAAQIANVSGDTLLGEDVKRCAVLLGKQQSVNAIDRQVTRSGFEIARHLPGVRSATFLHHCPGARQPSAVASAVVGSMIDLISDMRLAGKPPCWACSRII